MDEKFFRTELLLGAAALERLRGSTVAVFGIGGVGSFAVEALARTGIGRLILVDHDVVDVTNINRQLHATTKTIGQSKTALMKARILEINPAARVDVIDEFYLPSNGDDKFFIADYDCVVDAIDTISGKIGLVLECDKRGIPIVSSMGAGNKLDPTAFRAGDIFETTVDPIAKVMRKKLKALGIKKLRVVYSTEPPRRLSPIAQQSNCVDPCGAFLPTRPPTKKPLGGADDDSVMAQPQDVTDVRVAKKPLGGAGETLLSNQTQDASTVRFIKKEVGSISFVPSVAGLILAGEVIKMLVSDLL